MTEHEAVLVMLEHAIVSSQWKIRFLLDCIQHPETHKLEYPEQTEKFLEELQEMAKPPKLCAHSVPVSGCEACIESDTYRRRFNLAKETLLAK